MHSTHLTNYASKPCLCNDCVYNTRKDPIQILSNGNRIDRLYYNKFLPLRERKLLDKLVRTRAVYDDVRNRILSGSNTDINSEGARTDDDTIHTLVNLVDKGELTPTHSPVNLHSDCCSCCSCSSEIKLKNKPHVHMHIPSLENVNEYLEKHKGKVRREKKEARYRITLSDPCMCILKLDNERNKHDRKQKIAQSIKIHVKDDNSKIVQKQGPRVHSKGSKMQQKTTEHVTCECVNTNVMKEKIKDNNRSNVSKIGKKRVHYRSTFSDPCFCTLKLSNERNKNYRGLKYIQPKEPYTKKQNSTSAQKQGIKVYNKDAITQQKEIKTVTCECLNSKGIKKKIRDSIRSSVTKIENAFQLQKDSLTMFREKLRKKKETQNFICEPDYCVPYECIPEDCYEYMKKKSLNRRKQNNYINKSETHSNSTVSSQEPPERKSSANISVLKTRPRMLLKSTQASHKLNRCFCTLRLKPEKTEGNSEKHSYPKPSKPNDTVNPKNTVKSKNVKCLCDIKKSRSSSTLSSKSESIPKKKSPVLQRQNLKLLPYECEPLFCIPGECNPLVCEERIKQRNLTNSHNYLPHGNTNIVRRRGKMKSASATKTPPRSIQTRIPKQRNRALNPKPKEPSYAPKSRSSPNAPTRHVARITSNSRFDIEYFRDKNHPDANMIMNTNNNYANISTLKVESSRKLTQKKMNTMNETLFKRCLCTLKLLTAKQKSKTNKPFSSNDTVATQYYDRHGNKYLFDSPFKSRSSMTTAVVNYVVPPQNFPKNLLPYECEPNFCVPGQCDPYVCEKRIRMRNQIFRSRETNTAYTPKNSTSSITSSMGSRSAGTYPTRQKQRRRRNRGGRSSSETSKSVVSVPRRSVVSVPRKQAVKIGSSFKFDIEFSKTRTDTEINEKAYSPEIKPVREKQPKRERSYRRDRRTGGGHDRRRGRRVGGGPHLNSRMSQSSRSVKSRPTLTENFLKRCFCTLKLHNRPHQRGKRVTTSDLPKYSKIPGTSTQTRGLSAESVTYARPPATSGLLPYECEPNFCVPGQCDPIVCEKRIRQRNLLKRCFCTLKFHSPGMSSGSGSDRMVTPIESKSIGTETARMRHQKYGHKLLPYECEPGVCVPGQCNPYECQKRIDRRNMRDMYANTGRPRRRSSFSGTSMTHKTQDSQSSFKQPRQRQPRTTHYRRQRTASEVTTPSTTSYAPSLANKSRQAVKLSSQFSFNIEFCKNKPTTGIELRHEPYEVKTRHKEPPHKKGKGAYTQGFRISKDRGMRTGGEYHSRNSQADSDRSDKSTYADSRPERCFCTLKLHKMGRHNKQAAGKQVY